MSGPVVILGQGAWGAALGHSLTGAGAEVRFWRRDTGAAVLQGTDLVLSAVPAQATRAVLGALAPHLLAHVPIVLTAKGLERGTLALQSQIAEAAAPGHPVGVLTGPSFADDLTKGLPTAVTLAVADQALGDALQRRLATPSLRPYLTDDVTGAQIGGAVKNVIAIACGAAIGAGLGDSARAALMTRGFAEMVRIGTALGGRAETLGGLSGLGDLALTSTSPSSRNFRFGEALGRGVTPADLAADRTTYEGAATARPLADLAAAKGVDMPVATAVAALVEGGLDVPSAVTQLFNRPLKRE
ncbi:MAG: NAD(P)H-dependent glycerol-3-phosphate dehydrogenase [Paracoccaceae bacterium]|nr:NAD(P)H-dependent glycerol-3-phosphate dehydrogenase [Paracoccaceae bacterium]